MPFFSFVVEVYEESKCNVLLKFVLDRNESRFLLKVSKKFKVAKTYKWMNYKLVLESCKRFEVKVYYS